MSSTAISNRVVDLEFPNADVQIILAAAGNGKTTRLMDELAKALEVYRPDEIALATFTRKGVEVAVDKAVRTVPGLMPDDIPYFGTFHKLFFRSLGLTGKNILERPDMEKFNDLLGFNVHMQAAFDNQTEDDRLLQRYDALRSGSDAGVYVMSAYDEDRYTRLVNAYEAFKSMNNLVDYHDVLTLYREIGQPMNVRVALIDEFQDSTTLQCECIQKAFGHCERVRIVGDDYQTIFAFAGAVPETLIHLAQKYPTVKLEKSYRLSKAVYTFSRKLTSLISKKVDKDFVPARSAAGSVQKISDRSLMVRKVYRDLQACDFKPRRWFFLFRANCFIAPVAQLLDDMVVPYHTAQGFCLRKEYLQRISRFYKYRAEGYGDVETKSAFAKKYGVKSFQDSFIDSDIVPTERRYAYADYVERYGIDRLLEMSKEEPSLLLTTTYRVKGGEADNVAVFLDATRIVVENMMADLDGELRVMYVACTRARDDLYLVASEGTYGLDKIIELASIGV